MTDFCNINDVKCSEYYWGYEENEDDDYDELMEKFNEKESSFEKPLVDEKNTYQMIRAWQSCFTDCHGGYPYIQEIEVENNNKKYRIIFWGIHASSCPSESTQDIAILEI